MITSVLLGVLLTATGGAGLAPVEDGVGGGADAKAQTYLFLLRDGARLVGRLDVPFLKVRTIYGDLTIPIEELAEIRFGMNTRPELVQRIEALVEALADQDFEKRESATEELIEVGPPVLARVKQALAESQDEEVRARAESIIEEVEPQLKLESNPEGAPQEDDAVSTVRFSLKGSVLIEQFIILTRYGDFTVDKADVKSIAFKGPANLEQNIQLPANRSAGSGQWMHTKIKVERGDRLRMSSSGSIQIQHWGASGPAGVQGWPYRYKNFATGALIAKVGRQGAPFLVGAKYKGKTDRSGDLYLGIAVSSGIANSGSYKVKVKVER